MMDWLLKNDSWKKTVQLDRQQDSVAFLNFVYPEHILLSNNQTLVKLLDILETQGHYSRATKGKHTTKSWTGYPAVEKGKNSNREAELTQFLNKICAAIHKDCGISFL